MSNFSKTSDSCNHKTGQFPGRSLLEPQNPGSNFLTDDEWDRIAQSLNLSARQLEVAIQIFEGRTRDQIARRLNCAPATVRVHIDRLFEKLAVHERVGLVLRIVRTYLATRPASSANAELPTPE